MSGVTEHPYSAEGVVTTELLAGKDVELLLRVVQRGYEEGWNKGRKEVLDEILAPDFLAHDPSVPGGEVGKEGVEKAFQAIRDAFPDVRREVSDHVAFGNKIAVRWRVTGTHLGPFNGIPATGRAVDVSGITLYRFAGERIAEEWVAMDNLDLLRQLGLA